jgi:hypothetical protein
MKNLISKFSVLFFVSLIALGTSAFSQNNRVVGSPQALPMKDFPVQCMSLCEPQARAYDAIIKKDWTFFGCGNFPDTFGGMPNAPIGSIIQKIRIGDLDPIQWISMESKKIQDIKAGNPPYDHTPDKSNYSLISSELRICVLSNLIGVKYTGNLKDNNPTHTNPRLNNTQNPNSGGLGNQASNSSQQQQQQQLQAAVTQSQTRAREAQQRGDADAQRRGRRVHDPAAEAHECISVLQGGFGGFKNSCGYRVNVTSCNQNPRVVPGGMNWSADFDCAKGQFGLYNPDANGSEGAHTRNSEFVHWFACKAPALPLDVSYEGGGLRGRCR